jgi:hypothetical protein
LNHISNWNDTIAAIATPPGIGALGIIRLSGAASISIVNQLFPAKDLLKQPSHTLHIGLLQHADTVLDEVVVSLYKAPRSYTGEDIAEISCHGSPYVLQQVLKDNIKPDKKLEQKCKHCSERERAAMDSERAANKYKQVEYMRNYIGEEFEGVISGVSAFGFWVETVEHKCEGLVSLNSLLEFDDFRLIEGDYSLAGMRSGRKFRMGDKIRIKVVAANLTKRQLDYEWVVITTLAAEDNAASETGKKEHKKKKSKKNTH